MLTVPLNTRALEVVKSEGFYFHPVVVWRSPWHVLLGAPGKLPAQPCVGWGLPGLMVGVAQAEPVCLRGDHPVSCHSLSPPSEPFTWGLAMPTCGPMGVG